MKFLQRCSSCIFLELSVVAVYVVLLILSSGKASGSIEMPEGNTAATGLEMATLRSLSCPCFFISTMLLLSNSSWFISFPHLCHPTSSNLPSLPFTFLSVNLKHSWTTSNIHRNRNKQKTNFLCSDSKPHDSGWVVQATSNEMRTLCTQLLGKRSLYVT